MSENPWTRADVATQQRELVDRQLAEWSPRLDRQTPSFAQFHALMSAIRATKCAGQILELGCGSGYNREVLDRAGVEYREYAGIDFNETAIRIAKERYPESQWLCADVAKVKAERQADIVIDGSMLLHVEAWDAHIKHLCSMSRRWVILHRLPTNDGPTVTMATASYGQKFPAWNFSRDEIVAEMAKHGFVGVESFPADGDAVTLVFARPRHYVTYSDAAYLTRLKALHASMVRHCGPFKLHVLAWGDKVDEWADGVPGVETYTWYEFLDRHPGLALHNLPGPQRSKVEHYWTCGPQFIADVMEATGEPVTYVDADCYAFSSPEPMFAEAGEAPAGFVGHNFARPEQGLPGPTTESHGPFGKYNVGVIVANDVRVMERWAEMCREWCADRVELIERTHGEPPIKDRRLRYGDQKYLEDLFEEFPGCVEIKRPAAMVGPWNVHTRAWDVRDGVVHFGGRPLGFFHFSGLREVQGDCFNTRPEYMLTERQADIVYSRYWAALAEAKR